MAKRSGLNIGRAPLLAPLPQNSDAGTSRVDVLCNLVAIVEMARRAVSSGRPHQLMPTEKAARFCCELRCCRRSVEKEPGVRPSVDDAHLVAQHIDELRQSVDSGIS